MREAKDVWEKAHPGQTASSNDILRQVYDTTYNDTLKASGFGTCGQYQQAIQAATAAVQHRTSQEVIGHHTELSQEGKVAAHAVVNAALAAAQSQNAMAGAAGASTAEMVGMIAGEMYSKPVNELDDTQKQTVSALSTLAAGLAGGLVDDSGTAAVSGAQAGKTTVENNYLSSKQIDAWSAEMKSCQANGGDCSGIIKKYEELSTAQQQQLISDCATSPTTCQQKHGDVLADSLAVSRR